MGHLATGKYSYWSQLAILAGITGAGFIIGMLVSLIPFLVSGDLKGITGISGEEIMKKLLVPENANILRVVQFLTTLFLFFLPAWFYARISHKKPLTHLGFNQKTSLQQTAIVIFIMFACLPMVGALSELTEMIPFSESSVTSFKKMEDDYAKQINVIGRMNNLSEYFISLFMLAILPAVFEEVLFRGAVQNLFSRWWKAPILAIVVTSLLFSAVHFSVYGFLSRAALGFVLGWMYYRTGNIWLNIIAHAVNNAAAITALYITRLNDSTADLSKADPKLPLWLGIVSLAVVYVLFIVFERVSKKQIDRPGEEVLLEYEDMSKPSWTRPNPEKDLFN